MGIPRTFNCFSAYAALSSSPRFRLREGPAEDLSSAALTSAATSLRKSVEPSASPAGVGAPTSPAAVRAAVAVSAFLASRSALRVSDALTSVLIRPVM